MGKEYNRKDRFYELAKEEGYLSRAAYKLLEIQKKFRLVSSKSKVLDLGAAPGGWTQVLLELLGPEGILVAIDLVPLELEQDSRLTLIQGDLHDPDVRELTIKAAKGFVDSVLSDMSAKLTGINELDQAQSVACGEAAVSVARATLKAGGSLVIKLFKGQDTETFVKSLKPLFNVIKREQLESTRSTSNEFYLIATGFRR